MAHPLAIAFGQKIVGRHNMHTFTDQCIQINRHRRHQCFSFTRCHLGNFPLMQRHSTDQLHIERNHLPRQIVSRGMSRRPTEAATRILHGRKGFNKKVFSRFTLR